MKFKKIYIEITNSCNFHCSFCFKTNRSTTYMSVGDFRRVIEKIRPSTDYVYLHVLGEPLLHPKFDEILQICEENALKINLTTNGSLIGRNREILFKRNIRQINFSLHDVQENIPVEKQDEYLQTIIDFAKEIAHKTYINFRFWNLNIEECEPFNQFCLEKISQTFQINLVQHNKKEKDSGIKLSENIFLQQAARFEWPDGRTFRGEFQKNCYALRDHIAILADGSIIPCCLDADAHLRLGNILTDNLADIISSKKAIRIRKGFEQRMAVEEFCKTCGFNAGQNV